MQCGDNLYAVFEEETGTLTISGTGDFYYFTEENQAPWAELKSEIKAVVVEAGAASVTGFSDCTNLETVILADSVVYIDTGAFQNCSKLTELVLPANLAMLSRDVFRGCTSLKQIVIPGSLESIEGGAFADCTALEMVILNEGTVSIGDGAFENCTALKEITFPQELRFIYSVAFSGCTALNKITFMGDFPNHISEDAFTGVVANAFYSEKNTTWTESKLMDYGGSLTWAPFSLEEDAGGQCGDQLFWNYTAEDDTLVVSGTGAMYDYYSYDEAPWIQQGLHIKTIIVEEGVTTIGARAFCPIAELREVTLPESVTSIGDAAFAACENLTTINIPSGVTYIGHTAFHMDYSLENIVLPAGLTSLEMYSFADCTALTSITIPGSVEYIGEYALAGCVSLENVILEEGVPEIGAAMFQGCVALESIAVPASIKQIGYEAFFQSALSEITFLGDVPEFDDSCFAECTVNAYYPQGNATWTEDLMKDYGGSITWIPDNTHTHSYTASVVTPTCTEQGYTTYICECGDSYKDDYVDALGHEFGKAAFDKATKTHVSECGVCGEKQTENCTFDDGTVVREATMEKFGVTEYTCAVCGGSYEAETVYRVFGSGRSETAIAAAEELKEVLGIEKFDTIILASGGGFADALAGSYLAVKKDAPILLVQKSTIELNKNYILNNLAQGGTVYILGGPAAVPQEMEDALEGLNVKRLQGNDRYETNLLILEEAGIRNEEILICTGWDFADSLSASATGLPILMLNTGKNELTEDQTAFLEKYADNDFTIIGGTAAVSEALETAVKAVVGEVDRVYGESRENTSVEVAKRYFSVPDYAVVAYSRNFPDGLCGGPLAHALNAPLLLVSPRQETSAAEYIKTQGITQGFVLGGTAAVTEDSARIVFGMK